MARTANRNRNMVVAREAIVIAVGARPIEYRRITVTDRRTGERVEINDTDFEPLDEGDPGVPYAFRANERVSANHPAVKQSPHAFVPADEVDEIDQVEPRP